jgi:hypothetical protein
MEIIKGTLASMDSFPPKREFVTVICQRETISKSACQSILSPPFLPLTAFCIHASNHNRETKQYSHQIDTSRTSVSQKISSMDSLIKKTPFQAQGKK